MVFSRQEYWSGLPFSTPQLCSQHNQDIEHLSLSVNLELGRLSLIPGLATLRLLVIEHFSHTQNMTSCPLPGTFQVTEWERILLPVQENPRDAGSIPGSGRSTGEGNGYPLQYSCLENPMDREAWWATVHRVTKSQIWLSTHVHFAPVPFLTLSFWKHLAVSCPYNFALYRMSYKYNHVIASFSDSFHSASLFETHPNFFMCQYLIPFIPK